MLVLFFPRFKQNLFFLLEVSRYKAEGGKKSAVAATAAFLTEHSSRSEKENE